jgi:phosphoribosylanthranilate isomerase
MVRIKICGITRFEDARIAANLGADALGFNFFKKSPRYITPENAAQIIRQLPPFISRVGIFVDEDLSKVLEIAQIAGIDTLQLHGSESPDYCDQSPLPVLKVFSVKPDMDFSIIDTYKTAGILLDTWNGQMHGGSGKTFNWTIAKNICARFNNVVIAGGLGASNIVEALDTVHPYGVDINSGVEIMPGVKNPHKMRDVMKIVKNWKAV